MDEIMGRLRLVVDHECVLEDPDVSSNIFRDITRMIGAEERTSFIDEGLKAERDQWRQELSNRTNPPALPRPITRTQPHDETYDDQRLSRPSTSSDEIYNALPVNPVPSHHSMSSSRTRTMGIAESRLQRDIIDRAAQEAELIRSQFRANPIPATSILAVPIPTRKGKTKSSRPSTAPSNSTSSTLHGNIGRGCACGSSHVAADLVNEYKPDAPTQKCIPRLTLSAAEDGRRRRQRLLAPPDINRSEFAPDINHEVPTSTYIPPSGYRPPKRVLKPRPKTPQASTPTVKKTFAPVSPRIAALGRPRTPKVVDEVPQIKKGLLDYERAERVRILLLDQHRREEAYLNDLENISTRIRSKPTPEERAAVIGAVARVKKTIDHILADEGLDK
ncbi:hypothetical protein SmJEL517_g00471 [Synchytrium microbalum]|uniref:Uncharacterized protein n=1 Tax=Synchytrium microbalum TaxID=1806994 RepID=A0A507CE15_9FUNG|nr:uncharacterized protein SmJEL517_g00471 [Synchytrium microbalum]TPX37588.1 hypothetical protein SmJEL517_g00471 [Synchytrium microbalum]